MPGIVLGFVSLIGILWELHEFVLDVIFPVVIDEFKRQPDIPDTMMDFTMDLIGGILSLVAFWRK
ncbi:MAG: hypothetical protein UU63_C0001G0031 [Candidatus Uhrbacteria bacterium GW2011_GWF2_41_430]|nr:MAG: hypothetical protein UU63_C0001G0031 [Candidatus Uhrbacteria bacterium GW2011_GWF2_41_430]